MTKLWWEVLGISAGMGSIVGLSTTILHLLKVKNSVSISKWWLFSLYYIFAIWTIYGWHFDSLSLWLTDLICLFQTGIITILYYKYKPKEE